MHPGSSNETVPVRLDAVLQDSHVALSLVQRENVHVTSVHTNGPCVDGRFTDAGTLRHCERTRAAGDLVIAFFFFVAIFWSSNLKTPLQQLTDRRYHVCQRELLSAVWSSSLNTGNMHELPLMFLAH